jgi:hypothetical protein
MLQQQSKKYGVVINFEEYSLTNSISSTTKIVSPEAELKTKTHNFGMILKVIPSSKLMMIK